MRYQTKSVDVKLSDIDEKNHIMTGYFSVFGNIDSDGDMIVPGAFKRSIDESGVKGKDRIKHLKNHKTEQIIGKLLELYEDNYGLKFVSQLLPTTIGKDAFIEYKMGVLKEHSIGFQTINKAPKQSYVELNEIKLWEGSSVTWGANEMALTTAVKSLDKETLEQEFESLLKYVKSSIECEEKKWLFEIKLNQLSNLIYKEFAAKSTNENIEKEKIINEILLIYKK